MSVDLANVLWTELKSYIPSIDHREAAEIVVGILVDYDIDVSDIRREFKGDSSIKQAIAQYSKDHNDDYDDEDSDDYYNDRDEY